jgi:hypothetical protein
MGKVILAMALLAASTAANAIGVTLLVHNQTSSSGTISTLITNGSHSSGAVGPSTATFDWDGTTLTATGYYSATSSLGSSPYGPSVLSDSITDLSINTGTTSAGATAYACVEGTFLAGVGANGCGGYNLGPNYADESTTVWGPGTATSQTINGDDGITGTLRTIAAYDFGTVTLISGASTTAPGAIFSIGNGISLGTPSGEAMKFTVVPVPAAVWLFGSALGLLGWARRRSTQ